MSTFFANRLRNKFSASAVQKFNQGIPQHLLDIATLNHFGNGSNPKIYGVRKACGIAPLCGGACTREPKHLARYPYATLI